MPAALHHVELWTTDLNAAEGPWRWLLASLGWTEAEPWPAGRTWHHADGTYIVLEQSPAITGNHDRMHAGLNHLALNCNGRQTLDQLRVEAAANGWREMFGDRYPHAGGPDHTALFIENPEGFEVEIVTP